MICSGKCPVKLPPAVVTEIKDAVTTAFLSIVIFRYDHCSYQTAAVDNYVPTISLTIHVIFSRYNG